MVLGSGDKEKRLGVFLAFEDHTVVLGSRPANIRAINCSRFCGRSVLGASWDVKWNWVNSPCWGQSASWSFAYKQSKNISDMSSECSFSRL